FLITAIEKFQERPRFYINIVVGVLAAGLAITGGIAWMDHQRDVAHGELAKVVNLAGAPVVEEDAQPDDANAPSFASAEARREKVTAALDEVGGGVASEIADLYRAQIALDSGDAATARTIWEAFLNSNSDHALATSVRINLIHLDRQEDRATEVADRLQQELDGTKKTLPEDVLLFELAKTREALGEADAAKDLYQQIIDEYPTSGYVAAARQATT
ncbi:MAG: tetratricopeptide repeat protein, partial [Acidobacteriota bacterium]